MRICAMAHIRGEKIPVSRSHAAAAGERRPYRFVMFSLYPQLASMVPAPAVGVAVLPWVVARGAERQRVLKGLLFERSEFAGPPLA